MSRVRGKDTGLEKVVRSALHRQGYRFSKHPSGLPGKPDIVFPSAKVAVFVDGDFWHGYRFPAWRAQLTPFWQRKIRETRERDQRNFARLRRAGWVVVRIWQHEVKRDLAACVSRIADALRAARPE
jgi:DNA mismatch endonuclease (patch repair protein)